MKTKKIAERAKKKNPGKKDKKALSEKKKPGKALGAAAEKDSDITERKREEEKLIILHKTYLGIMNSLTEAVYIQDENGVFLEVNKTAEKFYGYPKEYFIGKTLESISAPGKNDIPMIAKAEKKAINGEPQSFEFWGLCKNGATFPASVNLTSGEYFGKKVVIATARDITEHKHAEEEIKMLATALKRINECVSITDVENTILFVNEAFLKAYGYSEQELIGQNIKIVRPPNSPQKVFEEVLPGTLSGGWTGELVNRRKDGSEFPIFLSTTIIEKKDGKANCLIGIAIDITERKRAELQIKEALETLRRSEENFRRSMDDSPLGVRVVTAKGETIYANKVLLDIYGYANMEELNKIPLKERYTLQSYAEFQMRKKDRERGDFGPSEYEINIVRKNGEIRHLQVLRNEVLWNGTRQFQVVYQDITERKQAESQREAALEALRESEEKYRTLFTSSSDAIMLIEPLSGKFISGNQTTMEMFGLKNDDDFSSFGPWDFSPERQPDERASAEKAKEMNEIAMRDGSNFFEWAHKRLNGEEFSANVRLTMMVLDKKTILQATVRDITERKRAEEKIKNSLAEKEILLKEVHHRVKNNLMIIIGLIKMQETKANNEMFNPLLQELEGRIRSMAQVHEGFYKSEDLAHIDLQNYIETMSAQIRAQFGLERNIHFSVQAVGVELGLDVAVPCGLILNELITNAYKHAFPENKPHSGAGDCEINVIVKQEGGMNVLTVVNNGIGLPADLDWEKSDTLGLRLIKMLSQQINGSIELDRSAGTAFRLKFPVAEKIH